MIGGGFLFSCIYVKLKISLQTLVFVYKQRKYGTRLDQSIKLKNPQYISLEKKCIVGENSKLLCWDRYIGDDKQNLAPSLVIGENFHATSNLTIQCCGKIEIDSDVLVASNVFICDYNHGTSPESDSFLKNPLEVSYVKIKKGVWIGQNVLVMPGVTIGEKSIIGAGSVVTNSIPPYCMAVGNPARVIKKYDFGTREWEKI